MSRRLRHIRATLAMGVALMLSTAACSCRDNHRLSIPQSFAEPEISAAWLSDTIPPFQGLGLRLRATEPNIMAVGDVEGRVRFADIARHLQVKFVSDSCPRPDSTLTRPVLTVNGDTIPLATARLTQQAGHIRWVELTDSAGHTHLVVFRI